jgi:hypothetical protein
MRERAERFKAYDVKRHLLIKNFLLSDLSMDTKWRFCPPLTNNELHSMPYSTRMVKMDRVGVEPTTSATVFQAAMERIISNA